MRNFNIYTGATGWDHAGWDETFYPHGLPEDWKLSFYNTQFRCVFLPYAAWAQASDAQVAGWLKEAQEDFCFVLGNPENNQERQAQNWVEQAARYGRQCRMEADVKIMWLDSQTNLRHVVERIRQSFEGGQALYLLAKQNGLAKLQQVGELLDVMGV